MTKKFDEWIRQLDEDVIQGEFGYEDGEFTVYTSHWKPLYDEGLTPRQAWQRALDGYAQKRREDDAAKAANYARIVSEDEAAVARERLARGAQ
jgi:branched-subunit amino acid aminotransferase/4-amino-4-deoxychorismate lyase